MKHDQIAEMLSERLPTPAVVALLVRRHAEGMPWDEIEDHAMGVVDNIAEMEMPMSDEAERYSRRILIAARALECHGMNN